MKGECFIYHIGKYSFVGMCVCVCVCVCGVGGGGGGGGGGGTLLLM